jgi:hypothetical protein
MSHNVLGWRRFYSPNKGLRSKTRAAKMWWSKMPQRAESPTGVLRNPNRPNRAVSANRLLCAGFVFFILIVLSLLFFAHIQIKFLVKLSL